MAISLTLTVFNEPYGVDMTNTRMILRGNAVWAAGTYVAGGQVPVAPPYLYASGDTVLIPTLNLLPDSLTLESVAGSGFVYGYNKSSGKVQVFTTGTAPGDALNELAGAGLPDAVVADVIEFVATFVKQ